MMDELTIIEGELDDSNISSSDLVLLCKEKAENGDTEAQRILAHAYYNGLVVEKDKHLAFMWLKRAENRLGKISIRSVYYDWFG